MMCALLSSCETLNVKKAQCPLTKKKLIELSLLCSFYLKKGFKNQTLIKGKEDEKKN